MVNISDAMKVKIPILSIIIPCRDDAVNFKQTLSSISEEPDLNCEIIVVDDESSEPDSNLLQELCEADPKIKLIRNKERLGVVRSQMKAAHAAIGKYLLFRGADDINLGRRLSHCIQQLEAHPSVGLACGDISWFHNQLDDGYIEKCGWLEKEGVLFPEAFINSVGERQIFGQTVIVRRGLFFEAGGFSERLEWASDLLTFLVIAFRYGIYYIPTPLAAVRLRSDSFSTIGCTDRTASGLVLQAFIETIFESYKDCLAAFAQSGWLGYFGIPLVEAVLQSTELWEYPVWALIQRNLYQWNRVRDTGVMDRNNTRYLKHQLSILQQKINKDKSEAKVVLYGAGHHTEDLLSVWRQVGMPPIHKIVTTKQTGIGILHGIQVATIDKLKFDDFGYMIISSKAFNKEMKEEALKRFPGKPIFSFYD